MSTEIEQRVVQMKFDNKQFEAATRTTLSTLDTLGKKLKFDNIQSGFKSLSSAAKNVDMEPLIAATETARLKFSALDVMAVTALTNITNSVINAGKTMLSSLTIEPISLGFSEYELKMQSVQTIMASTGADINTVNGYLNELNTYSDKTIYSFSDMTESIGKFTNAGVSLEDSVLAIKGISNAAAVSGANANEASRAMYNFAQALSSGSVKLMDWKSIELANMATQEFKQQLIDSAVAAGTLTQGLDGMYYTLEGSALNATKGFNESLQDQWMTTDVLISTLKDYSDETTEIGKKAYASAQDVKTFSQMLDTLKETAQSGWATTFEILFGNLEQAKTLWTGINNVVSGIIDGISDSRNNLLQGWADLGGRDMLLEGLRVAMENLGKIAKAVGDAFREVFPPATAENLLNITKGFTDLVKQMSFSEKTLEGVKNIFKAIFQVIEVFVEVIKLPLKFLPGLVAGLGLLSEIVLRVAGVFGKVVAAIGNFLTSGNKVDNLFTTMGNGFTWIIGKVKEFVDWFDLSKIGDAIQAVIPGFEKVRTKTSELTSSVIEGFRTMNFEAAKLKLLEIMTSIGEWFTNKKNSVKEWFTETANVIKDKMSSIASTVMDFMKKVEWDKVFKIATGAVSAKFFLDIGSFFKSVGGALERMSKVMAPFAELTDGIKNAFDSLSGTLDAYSKNLKMDAVKKLAIAVALVAGSIYLISKIEPDRLIAASSAIGIMMAELTACMVIMNKWGSSGVKGLFSMGAAILMMASAVKILGGVDTGALLVGLGGLLTLVGAITAYSVVMSKTADDMTISGLALVGFASAILILTFAVKKLADMEAGQLAVAVTGIIALTTAVALSSRLLSGVDNGKGTMKILSFALAIKQLSKAIILLKDLKVGELVKGLATIGTLMLGLGVFVKTINASQIMSSSVGLLIIAGALTAMIVPMTILAKMNWGTVIDGLIKIGATLTVLGVTLSLFPKNMPSLGAGLLIVSAALVVMSGAMALMGAIPLGNMVKSLMLLGGSLTALAFAMNAMVGTMPGSTALLVASGALVVLAGALAIMGNLKLSTIFKSLLTLAGALGILAGVMLLLAPAAPVLMAVATATLTFSAACLVAGVGVAALGLGIMSLIAAFTLLGGSLVAIMSTAISAIGLLFLGFVKIAPAITEGIAALLLAAIKGLTKVIPALVEGIVEILSRVMASLAEHSEQIVTDLVKFLIGVIRGLSAYMPDLVYETVNLLVVLMSSVLDAIKRLDFDVLVDAIIGAGIFSMFLAAVTALSPFIGPAALALLGFAGLVTEFMAILALLGGIAQIPGLTWLMDEGTKVLESIGTAIGRFIGGLIGGLAQGATASLPTIGEHLSEFMVAAKPFFENINLIDGKSVDSIATLIDAVTMLTANSLIDGIATFIAGGSPIVEFGKKLAEFAPYYRFYAEIMSGVDGRNLEKTSNAVKTLAEFAKAAPSQSELSKMFFGERNLVAFGQQLAEFAPYFKMYADNVSGINADSITATSAAVESLMKYADLVPNQGGLAALFCGENSLATFGSELSLFGVELSKYSQSVAGVDAEAVSKSAAAVSSLMEFAKLVPNKGGLVSLFTGDNTLSSLAGDLVEFGPAIKSYSDSVAGINVADVASSTVAGSSLVEFIKTIPSGDFKLKEFSKNIDEFGDAIGDYSKKVSGLDVNGMTNAMNALVDVVDISNKMINFDSGKFSTYTETMVTNITIMLNNALTSVQAESDKFKLVGDRIVTNIVIGIAEGGSRIQNGISSMMNKIVDTQNVSMVSAVQNTINSIVGVINRNIGTLNSSGVTIVSSINTGVNNSKNLLLSNISSLINNIITVVRNIRPIMNNSGMEIMNEFARGISSRRGYVINTVSSIGSTLASAIRSQYNPMYNAGSYLVSGLSSGISDNAYRATRAATNLANQVARAARNALDIHSPSRVFEEIGMFLDEGLARGLIKYAGVSVNATDKVGNSVADRMREAMSAISFDNIGGDAPTIRPVLDLTDIKKGSGAIQSLLGNRSLDVSASISGSRKLATTMGAVQNGDNGILDALKDLKNTIANSTGNTYNTISGITYDDSSSLNGAIKEIVRAARMERRR